MEALILPCYHHNRGNQDNRLHEFATDKTKKPEAVGKANLLKS